MTRNFPDQLHEMTCAKYFFSEADLYITISDQFEKFPGLFATFSTLS